MSNSRIQNKTLVGQLRRLHQIIVNKGGIGSSKWQQAANPGQAASMQGQGQHATTKTGLSSTGGQGQGDNKGSTALMVLLLSTALFLIPGMKDQLGKLSKILFIRLVAVDCQSGYNFVGFKYEFFIIRTLLLPLRGRRIFLGDLKENFNYLFKLARLSDVS